MILRFSKHKDASFWQAIISVDTKNIVPAPTYFLHQQEAGLSNLKPFFWTILRHLEKFSSQPGNWLS